MQRHAANHLPAALAVAQQAQVVARADTLLQQVEALKARAYALLDTAEASGDIRAAVVAIREVRECIALLARVAGELQDGPTVNVSVNANLERATTIIMSALAQFPEARVAVAAALFEQPTS